MRATRPPYRASAGSSRHPVGRHRCCPARMDLFQNSPTAPVAERPAPERTAAALEQLHGLAARRPPAPAHAPSSVRPEIKALRAVAVLTVVIFHFWPDVLPGGFVGVDVFFAISGFLITSLLLREGRRHGRLSLRDFWARRARRILPAALVVLLFCALATLAFVPSTH